MLDRFLGISKQCYMYVDTDSHILTICAINTVSVNQWK